MKDYRSWDGEVYEHVAGNYYPVTTQISIKDKSTQLFIVNDRPQGGSSIRNGEVELMVSFLFDLIVRLAIVNISTSLESYRHFPF